MIVVKNVKEIKYNVVGIMYIFWRIIVIILWFCYENWDINCLKNCVNS